MRRFPTFAWLSLRELVQRHWLQPLAVGVAAILILLALT